MQILTENYRQERKTSSQTAVEITMLRTKKGMTIGLLQKN
jgi:hypothetical protein